MIRRVMFCLLVLLMLAGCARVRLEAKVTAEVSQGQPKAASISVEVVNRTVEALVAQHGESERPRIEVGVRQAAQQWWPEDGSAEEFSQFCEQHFTTKPEDLAFIFKRFEVNLEQIRGYLSEISRHLETPLVLDLGPVREIDMLFAKYDPWSHMQGDFYSSKVAFVILLNFERPDLDALLAHGVSWERRQWAGARMSQHFTARVPSRVQKAMGDARIEAEQYVADYNIHMHHLLSADGRRLFPEGLKLVSHWGLRDELKSRYKDPDGLEKQRMLLKVMEKILAQEIPAAVVDNPHLDWNLSTGEVQRSDVIDFDEELYAHKNEWAPSADPEGVVRFNYMLANFAAERQADRFYPSAPTYIDRSFDLGREIPRERVEELLISVLTADVLPDVARLIEQRLGRKLEPFDVWYNGFATAGVTTDEAELDKKVAAKYPTVDALQADLPRMLVGLGFDDDTASYLSDRIAVDPSRGAGHAMPAAYRKAKVRLRTRVPQDGMNYKGFEIAVHELGHNVEQVFSLYDVDHYLLSGVPNIAFSEGFAFSFQERHMELLGLPVEGSNDEVFKALDRYWHTVEMSSVALIDMRIWDWLYAHPEANAEQLGQAVLEISKGVWNEFLAPVYGVDDQYHLGIYSHFLYAILYTPNYPLGKMIHVQMDQFFKEKGLAGEMKRMCTIGSLTPDEWMKQAVGSPISSTPLIEAARQALQSI